MIFISSVLPCAPVTIAGGRSFVSAGVVGRRLISMQKSDPEKVLEAFFGCLTTFNYTLTQSLR